MKKCRISALILCIAVWFGVAGTFQPAHASFQLYNGKLEISGFIKNTTYYRTNMCDRDKPYHDSKIDFSKNSALFEVLYNFRETDTYSLRFFGSVRYWYEMMSQIDDELRRSIPSKLRRGYRNPRSFDDDVLTELYVDYVRGPWDIRIGKQIVTWGELDVDRACDVVNPIDLRWGVPGIEAWEEIKRPIWMIRTTYQSTLPGNLLFETIFNPGHFLSAYPAPPTGTHWSASQFRDNPFSKWGPGVFGWQLTRWMHEAREQRYDIHNWQLGLRVRGYTYNIDWTLLWWNAPASAPIVDPIDAKAYTSQYFGGAIPAVIQGKQVSWSRLPDPTDYPHDVFKWRRYQIFGGTAQTTFNNFMPSAVWRCEIAYGRNEPFNVSTDQTKTNIYGVRRQDTLAVAFSWSDKWTIPWVTRHICTGKQMDTTITYYRQNILNRSHDLVTQDYFIDKSDTFSEKISIFMQLAMFNQVWTLTTVGSYYTKSDRWFICPTLTYMFPGEHWRCDIGWKGYGTKHGYLRGSYFDKDSVIFRLRYEF